MPHLHEIMILKDDVFALTAKGKKELGEAGTLLSAAELEVLVLLDGISTAAETVSRVPNREDNAGCGTQRTRQRRRRLPYKTFRYPRTAMQCLV